MTMNERLLWKPGDIVFLDEPALRHRPGGHDHDQSTHGNWAEGAASDASDLPVTSGFAGLDPRAQALILARAETLGADFPRTPDEMAQILDELYRDASDEQIAAGLDWYDDANRKARAYADQYGVDFDTACAVIARTSPGRDWDSNIELARRVMEVQSGNAAFEVTAEGYESLRDKAGVDGPGSYLPSDLKPEQLAWLHPAFKDKALGKTYEHIPQTADAIRLVRGEMTADSALGGPKIRNFYNNIHDPEDPRWVTIDTWQVRGSLPGDALIPVKTKAGTVYLATRTQNKAAPKAVDVTNFTSSPSLTVKGEKILTTGMYSMFAEAVKIGAERAGMLPNEYQAITWLVLREEDVKT